MSAYEIVYRVQCKTFAIWREMLGIPDGDIAAPVGHPISILRIRPEYRTEACKVARKALANRVRSMRGAA